MAKLTTEEIIQNFRDLKASDPALTDDETLAEVNDLSEVLDNTSPEVCWSRASRTLPRLRINTVLAEYLIPWYCITQCVVKPGYRTIYIYTTLGQLFVINASTNCENLSHLFGNLQLERVKEIHPTPDCSVTVMEDNEE